MHAFLNKALKLFTWTAAFSASSRRWPKRTIYRLHYTRMYGLPVQHIVPILGRSYGVVKWLYSFSTLVTHPPFLLAL